MRIDTIPEGALLMYDNNQQSALGVKNCKVNNEEKMICGQQLNFPYTIMGEMYETLITEKMKNAQFQQ